MPKFIKVSKGNIAEVVSQASQSGNYLIPGKPREFKGNFDSDKAIFFEPEIDESILAYDPQDQVITVSTGTTCGELRKMLDSNKQFFPLAGDDSTLLFELANTGATVLFDERFGGLRSLALGAQVALSTGEIINCGGRVVKNVTGYDLTKLFVGSRCTLGIPLALNLRLSAKSSNKAAVCLTGADLEIIAITVNKTLSQSLPLTGLQVSDDCQSGQSRLFKLTAYFDGSLEVLDELSNELASLWKTCLEEIGANAKSFQIAILSQEKEAMSTNVYVSVDRVATDYTTNSASMELVAPRSTLFKLWQLCLSLEPELYGHMQASSCRLRLYARHNDTIKVLVSKLEQWSTEERAFLVGYSDDAYEYIVRRLPKEDEGSVLLKRELKQKFDPHNILNPLVSL